MWRIIILTVALMLAASGAAGEYYKYMDENGTVRFTDDMTQIPEDQQEAAEVFASEISTSGETGSVGTSMEQEAVQRTENNNDVIEYATPAGDTFETRAVELNQIQAELNKTRRALDEERATLQAQIPGEDATDKEKIAYRSKVDALNARIERYGEDIKAFEEKVEAFNNRGRTGEPE